MANEACKYMQIDLVGIDYICCIFWITNLIMKNFIVYV